MIIETNIGALTIVINEQNNKILSIKFSDEKPDKTTFIN
jgi:hypothetical protein